MSGVEVRLLGAVELLVDGRAVPLGPARQRAVLAALAVDAGRPVLLDVLIARVWDDDPPEAVRSGLYSYVTRLRRPLRAAGDRVGLSSRAGGYVLEVDPETVDLVRFRRLARTARGAAEPDAGEFREALALWHGPALAGLSGAWVTRTREQLEQERLDVVLGWAQAELRAGRPAAVVGTLRELAAEHPLVEPLAARLVEALHRDGRTAEALDHYAAVRRHLVDELGTEPGPELRELHEAILRGDGPRPGPVATGRTRPGPLAMLPADTGAFTGREREIDRITASAADGRVVVIHAIAGMPGIGKTALAVHVAHRLGDRFPDGCVFVDLHGYTAGREPAEPGHVLARLLAADGVDPRRLPESTEERSALWRERLAGRRSLVVLDNAVDSAQVAPLLPGAAGCLVLVTSRRFLGDLPAAALPVMLGVLTPAEAAEMFLRLAPQARADADRVAELVAACGHLPLAVSLLARVLNRHRGWTVADLLTETRSRLLDVAAEHASVAAAFALSYRDLPVGRQRFFRRLALHPGTEIEPHAAAVLAGVPLAAAVHELDALHADSLLIEIGYHRYVMHDLIRSYAGTLAAADAEPERRAATERLLDHYGRTAAEADAQLRRVPRPATAAVAAREPADVAADAPERPDVADPGKALSWLRTERANLLACLARTGDPRRTVALTAGLTEVLRRDGPWADALVLHAAAAAAADGLGAGIEHADALADLAAVRRLSGDYPGAEKDLRSALDAYRRAGSRLGEALALTDLGKVLSRSGAYPAAAVVVGQALDLYRGLRDPLGEAGALVELAVARGMTSDFPGARDLLREGLVLYRRLGDLAGQAYTLRILGIANGRVGDFTGMRELLHQALELYRHLGGRLGQALTLTELGRAEVGLGDHVTGALTLRTALHLHRELDHRVGQSTALFYLGCALRKGGQIEGAAAVLHVALALNRDIGNRSGEAMALNELGAVYLATGEVDRAVRAHREALAVAGTVPSPWDEAQAVAGFGRCAMAEGRYDAGVAQLREAFETFRRLGAAEATDVAAELAALS
jgi:DNA-binding SARP family transcriptional activator/tetratricopeptide (TPR) repeat protein